MTGPQGTPPPPEQPATPEPVAPEPMTPAPEPITPAPEPITPVPEPITPVPEPITPAPTTPEPVTPDPTAAGPTTPEPPPAPTVATTDPEPDPAPDADPEPDPASDADPDAAPDASSAPARRRSWLPLAAVGAAVALLVAGTGTLAWQLRQQSEAELARDEAIAAARDAARLLFSYDHSTLDDDFAAGLAVTTGGFREQYSRTTVEVVRPVAEQYDAVVEAEVIQTAVVEASPSAVTALVFLNQATTSTRVQGQQVDQSRVRMRLVDRGGEWLVEDVRAL